MIGQIGAPIGLIVASALFAYFVSLLSQADFLSWGWRYPFFVAFAINVVALFARLRIVVTPTFQAAFKTLELHPTPVTKAVREEGGSIVIGAFAPLASFAMFHMVTVFPLSWVFLYTDEAPSRFLMIELIGAVFGLIAIMASGWLADRYGRRALMAVTAAGIAAFSGFAPQLLDGGPAGAPPGLGWAHERAGVGVDARRDGDGGAVVPGTGVVRGVHGRARAHGPARAPAAEPMDAAAGAGRVDDDDRGSAAGGPG